MWKFDGFSKVTPNFESDIVMGSFNIDTKCKGVCSNNLGNLCDLFYLTNIITSDNTLLRPMHQF